MFKRTADPLKKSVETLYYLRLMRDKISSIHDRISERRNMLYEKLIELEEKGERYLAKRYAEEIAKLDKLLYRLATLRLVTEKIDLALQYAIVMRDFNQLVSELLPIMKDLAKLPELNIPDIGLVFAEMESSLRELGDISTPSLTYSVSSSNEIKSILEEAKEVLKKRLEPENATS